VLLDEPKEWDRVKVQREMEAPAEIVRRAMPSGFFGLSRRVTVRLGRLS